MSKKKLVPRLRFKEFEKDGEWKKLRLDELVNIVDGDRGTNYPSKKDFTDNGHTLFLNASNVTKLGFKFEENQYISEIKSNLMGNGKLLLNDIILTSRGSIGNIAIYNEGINRKYPYVRINSGMLILRNRNIADSYFIGQYLKSPSGKYQIKLISFGSAQPQLTKDDVSNYSVVHPIDLSEQRRIGDFLNKFDAMIQLQQSKVNKVKDIKSAYLSEMFPKGGEDYPIRRFEGFHGSWETCHLGQVAGINKGEQLNSEKMIKSGKYYVLNGGINASGYTNNYNTKEQTISISEGGNSCGYVNYNEEKFWSGGHNYALTNPKINVLYLYYFLKSRQDEIMSLRVGSGLPNIQITALSEFYISYPLRDEQEKIGQFFKNLDNQISIEEEKLSKLEKLKQAYLNDMFI